MLTAEQALAKVNQLYDRLVEQRRKVTKLESYFGGEQPLAYASEEWKKFHRGRYKKFSDNWCAVVGRAAPERMELFGLRLGEDADVQSPDERQLWRDWELNDGPAQSAQGFLTSAVAKRSAVLVWGDAEDEPVLSWEHPNNVVFDKDGRQARYVLKVWDEGDLELATLYDAEALYKYQRPITSKVGNGQRTESGLYVVHRQVNYGGWRAREVPEDDGWPLRHPMGLLPWVEWPNRPLLGSGPISDIEGTIAMQDAINLMWAYLFTAADFASMPARVVMGQEPPKMPVLNSDGVVVGEKPLDVEELKNGRMLWLTGQGTSIGQWDAAKLDVFTSALNVMVKHVASQTRTPIHYIMGELGNVNGETLTATELPLAMKVREGHKHSTGPARETFRRMALVRGDEAVAEACRTAVVQWKNPETSSDAQTSDAALKDTQVGWPFAAVLERRYGLSQPEIARVMAMREAEANDPLLAGLLRDVVPAASDAAGG